MHSTILNAPRTSNPFQRALAALAIGGLALPALAGGPDLLLGIDASLGGQTNFQPLPGVINDRTLPNDIVVRVATGGTLVFPRDYSVSLTIDGKTFDAVPFDSDLIPPINRLVQNDRDFTDDFDEFRLTWRGYAHGTRTITAQTLFTGAATPPNAASAQVTVPISTVGPDLSISIPAPGTDLSTATQLRVVADTDLTARSVQAFITVRNKVTTIGVVNLANANQITFTRAVGNFTNTDFIAGIALENGSFPVRVIAATGLNATGIRSEAVTTVTVSGLPTPPAPPSFNTNGDIGEYIGLPPLAVSNGSQIVVNTDPAADFGSEGTLRELHGRVSSDGLLHLAVRGEFFPPAMPTANSVIILLDTDPGAGTGATQFLATGSDITDPDTTNPLKVRIAESGFRLSNNLRLAGSGFDAALIIDRVNPLQGGLFSFGTGRMTTGSLNNLVPVPATIAFSRGQDIYPAAAGTNIPGPDAIEIAIPLSSLGNLNPRQLSISVVMTSDQGTPSPNLLPENASVTFETEQVIEELAGFPNPPTILLSKVANNEPDQVEIAAEFTQGSVDFTSWSLRWSDASGLSEFLPLDGLVLDAGDRRFLVEGNFSSRPEDFLLGFNIPWHSSRSGSAALIDPYGLGVDYVRWEGFDQETRRITDLVPFGTEFFEFVPAFDSTFDSNTGALVVITRDQFLTDRDLNIDWFDGEFILTDASIAVLGLNDNPIANGDFAPDDFDGTRFPNTPVGDFSSQQFAIVNNGLEPIRIDEIEVTGNDFDSFLLFNEPIGEVLQPGERATFGVDFSPFEEGLKTAEIRIAGESAGNRSPQFFEHEFGIEGTAAPLGVLEILSADGSFFIANGSSTPNFDDGTDFGTLGLGTFTRTFLFSNPTDTPVDIAGNFNPPVIITGADAAKFRVLNQPPNILGPRETVPVEIEFTADEEGSFFATVEVPGYVDQPNQNPIFGYTFAIQAAVEVVPALLEVRGAGILITPGDTTPDTADGTDYGQTVINQPQTAFIDRTYTLIFNGADSINIFGARITGANATDFTVIAQPPTSVISNNGVVGGTFTVRFTPTALGIRTATVELDYDDGASPYIFAIQGEGINSPGGFVQRISNSFPTWSGWIALGQRGELFKGDIGFRCFDHEAGAIGSVVQPSTRARILGWIEEPNNDVPYSAVGPGQYVRSRFAMYYEGPGNSASPTLANQVPNFRISLRTRGVVNTQLEINHNAQTGGSINQFPVTRELGPSKDPTRPSIYRIDLDPVDVPYLASSPSEGIQRGFETLVPGGNAAFVSGVLYLTESTLGTYPVLADREPSKVFGTGFLPNTSGLDNSNVLLTRLGASTSEIVRYLTGPSQADYFNPAIINIVQNEPGITITRGINGVTVNSGNLPTTRIGVADAAFVGGLFGEQPEQRLRIQPGRLYEITYRVRHAGASDTTPYIRFNARTAGFGYNATLELLGGRGLPGTDARTFLQQVLPGTGNQVPGTTIDGTTYRLLFHSPLAPDLRADVTGSLEQKFPNLMAQPGPGSPNSISLRNIDLGFTVVDSLSLANSSNTDAAEVANNLNLNLIEVREHPVGLD